MDQILTADEVFGIGVEIEKNGYAFYSAAAAAAAGEGIRKLLLDLASWETKHIETFTALREHLSPEALDADLYDPGREITMYLKATADNHVFVKGSGMEELAATCKTPLDILNIAMSFEKDSVVFYSMVSEAVSASSGRAEVERLIHEELTHIGYITRELQKIKAAARGA
jgi:rubrerythrin